MMNYAYLGLGVLWGFYNSVEPTFSFLGEEEFFLIKKLLIKAHTLWDPFHIAILLIKVKAQDISF